jgi:predicted ATPase
LNLPLLNSYFTPLSEITKADLFDSFNSHSHQYCANGSESHEGSGEIAIPVMMGRTVKVTVNQKSSGACYVDFKYLCETDRGASDYHAICKHFDTVFLHGIPQLSVLEHDRARRFITLIDEVYDAGIHLVWSAEMEPNMMFRELTPVEIIVEKKEGKAFGTDHGWGKDPNKVEKKSGNPWLDQNSKNDTYAAVSHIYQAVDASNDELKLLEGELSSVQELKFAFKRAASRLTEMAGSEYLKNWTIKYKKVAVN